MAVCVPNLNQKEMTNMTETTEMEYDGRIEAQISKLNSMCDEMLMDPDAFEYIRDHVSVKHADEIIDAIETLTAQLILTKGE